MREGREKDVLIYNFRIEKDEVETNLGECKNLVKKFEIEVWRRGQRKKTESGPIEKWKRDVKGKDCNFRTRACTL